MRRKVGGGGSIVQHLDFGRCGWNVVGIGSRRGG